MAYLRRLLSWYRIYNEFIHLASHTQYNIKLNKRKPQGIPHPRHESHFPQYIILCNGTSKSLPTLFVLLLCYCSNAHRLRKAHAILHTDTIIGMTTRCSYILPSHSYTPSFPMTAFSTYIHPSCQSQMGSSIESCF